MGIQASGCVSLKDIFKKKIDPPKEDDDSPSLTSIPSTSNTCLPQVQRLKTNSSFENKDDVDHSVCSGKQFACVEQEGKISSIDKEDSITKKNDFTNDVSDDIMKLNNDLDESYWFSPPKTDEITDFFKYHPIQPNVKLLNSEKLYKRKDKTWRKWITYSKSQQLYFCSIGMTCISSSTRK